MNSYERATGRSVPTSLGRMLDPIPTFLRVDTKRTLRRSFTAAMNYAGHPWIDSPIFDRLAGERFGM